nr:MAG TPA_asm: hypothetical protein [Caudoviricetes sp.]
MKSSAFRRAASASPRLSRPKSRLSRTTPPVWLIRNGCV